MSHREAARRRAARRPPAVGLARALRRRHKAAAAPAAASARSRENHSMSEVDALERDVEAARARLVNRVAQLKSPPISAVKDELVADATEYKDEMIDSAKEKITGAIDAFVADVKRRAAANPAAVAAIGAG